MHHKYCLLVLELPPYWWTHRPYSLPQLYIFSSVCLSAAWIMSESSFPNAALAPPHTPLTASRNASPCRSPSNHSSPSGKNLPSPSRALAVTGFSTTWLRFGVQPRLQLSIASVSWSQSTKGEISVVCVPPGTRRQLAKDRREDGEKAQGNCPVVQPCARYWISSFERVRGHLSC